MDLCGLKAQRILLSALLLIISFYFANGVLSQCAGATSGDEALAFLDVNCEGEQLLVIATLITEKSASVFFLEVISVEAICIWNQNISMQELIRKTSLNAERPLSATVMNVPSGANCTFVGCYKDIYNTYAFETESCIYNRDECYLNEDDCHENATCTNTIDSFECQCVSMFTGDGRTCIEKVNECELGVDMCDTNAACSDTPESYNCTCKNGYRGNGFNCTDIDECMEGIHICNNNAICNNTDGGYNCTCNDEYEGNGLICTINECELGVDMCDTNAACSDTPESYTCTCNKGYRGNGFNCTDIDECVEGIHICDNNATCSNTDGGYNCTCNDGYEGNGLICTSIPQQDSDFYYELFVLPALVILIVLCAVVIMMIKIIHSLRKTHLIKTAFPGTINPDSNLVDPKTIVYHESMLSLRSEFNELTFTATAAMDNGNWMKEREHQLPLKTQQLSSYLKPTRSSTDDDDNLTSALSTKDGSERENHEPSEIQTESFYYPVTAKEITEESSSPLANGELALHHEEIVFNTSGASPPYIATEYCTSLGFTYQSDSAQTRFPYIQTHDDAHTPSDQSMVAVLNNTSLNDHTGLNIPITDYVAKTAFSRQNNSHGESRGQDLGENNGYVGVTEKGVIPSSSKLSRQMDSDGVDLNLVARNCDDYDEEKEEENCHAVNIADISRVGDSL